MLATACSNCVTCTNCTEVKQGGQICEEDYDNIEDFDTDVAKASSTVDKGLGCTCE